MKGRWYELDREDFLKSMKLPFRRKKNLSIKSIRSKERENSKETIIKRVLPQIKEMNDKGLPWNTPEEWDNSFILLGGGSTYRKSKSILSRMTWKEFISIISEIKD